VSDGGVTDQQTSAHDTPASVRLTSDRTVLVAVLATTALSLVGAAVSVAGDLSPTYLDALGPDGHLSVPLPMTVFQVVMAVLAGTPHRRRALAGSALLAVAVTAALVSGLFDGGYTDDRLSAGQRAVQVLLVLGLAAVAALAGRRLVQVLRSPR
jgi:hypothetical protein